MTVLPQDYVSKGLGWTRQTLLPQKGMCPKCPSNLGVTARILLCWTDLPSRGPMPLGLLGHTLPLPSWQRDFTSPAGLGQGGHLGQWEGHGAFYSQGQSPAQTKAQVACTAA